MSEAPERVWLDWPGANRGEPVYDEPPENENQAGQIGYIRADLYDAVVAERDEAQALIYAARQERNAAEDQEKELAEELRRVKAERDALRTDMRAIHHMTTHIDSEVNSMPVKNGVATNNIRYASQQIREWSGRHVALSAAKQEGGE